MGDAVAQHQTASRKTAGRRPATPVPQDALDAALREVMTAPWVDVSTMATLLKIGLQSAYREAQAGRFGAFRVGSLYRIPTGPLREALGLTADHGGADKVAA